MTFKKILKWDSDEPRSSNGRWSNSFESINLDTLDDHYHLPEPAHHGAKPDEDYEFDAPKAPKRLYKTDPKNIADVFKQFQKDGCLMESAPMEMARKWHSVMGEIHPHEVMRAFLGKDGLHNHNMSELAINIDEKEKRLTVATHGEDAPIDVHGAKATAFARFIHMGDPKSVEHSVLKLEKADQGGGVVKQLFKACVPLYDKLGMKHISVCANVDGGAYAWAKYGFEYFDANEKKQHAQQIKQAIFTHTKGKKLTEDSQEELAAIQKVLADKGNSKTVWHLSDLQTPALDEQFRSTIGRTFKKKGNFMKLLFLGGDVKGSRWAGKLSLDSKSPARARLSKYVGL